MLVRVWAQEESCWRSSVSRHWPEGEGMEPGRPEQTGAMGMVATHEQSRTSLASWQSGTLSHS